MKPLSEAQRITVTELQRDPVGVRKKLRKYGVLHVYRNYEFQFAMLSKREVEKNEGDTWE
jgi:hypothetical protein